MEKEGVPKTHHFMPDTEFPKKTDLIIKRLRIVAHFEQQSAILEELTKTCSHIESFSQIR